MASSSLDVAMRQGAFDDEELVGVDQGFVFEHAPEALDLALGQMGEVAARVRLWTFLPSRRPSRRRMAGGELRLGTVSTYMGLYYHISISCQNKY